MAESIVKVPRSPAADWDFIAFSFNGKHSYDDFGIYRVSDGDRYNDNLAPTLTDKTAEVPGGDGLYYFGTTHKQRDFNISFAFDNISEEKYREMKQWLNGKEMGDLWFAEAPYKIYTVKVTGTPTIKALCFEVNGKREYRGEGSVVFTAYWPYAHTPDFVVIPNIEATTSADDKLDGKSSTSYEYFGNYNQWIATSGLIEQPVMGDNPGDLPAPFIFKAPDLISAPEAEKLYFKVGDLEIVIPAMASTIEEDSTIYTHYSKIEWDSKTGIVSALIIKDGIESR